MKNKDVGKKKKNTKWEKKTHEINEVKFHIKISIYNKKEKKKN